MQYEAGLRVLKSEKIWELSSLREEQLDNAMRTLFGLAQMEIQK